MSDTPAVDGPGKGGTFSAREEDVSAFACEIGSKARQGDIHSLLNTPCFSVMSYTGINPV